jgi:hypothetical protein
LKKDAKEVVKKLNWKGWTFVIATSILAFVLVPTYFMLSFKNWLYSIFIPVIISGVASIGVSLWFTARIELDNIYRDLQNELHELFDYGFQLDRNLESTLYSLTIPLAIKRRLMIIDTVRKPRLAYISKHYAEYYKFFDEKQKELIELIGGIDPKANKFILPSDDPFYDKYIFLAAEIADNTLKLQEQILQDFKIIPKGPIKDQLVFRLNSTQDKNNT